MLKDTVVLDLADERGSFCSKLLAELGATVIKLEKPGGDSSRIRSPLSFFYNNTNKLGVVLDLQTAEGKRAFDALTRRADVIIETYDPGSLESLIVLPRRLHRLNPRLVHLSITPFGRTGPRRNYRSCDAVASAFGGQMYVSGTPADPPSTLSGCQSYYTASLFGAVAILLRLKKRMITGKGGYFDLSIQEAVVSTLDRVFLDYFHYGRIARRGEVDPGEGFSILPCWDGYVQITILRNWETLLELMASEGMAGDLLEEKWGNAAFREQHIDHIAGTVEKWVKRHSKREILELGQSMRFPWASVDSTAEVLRNPQLESRDFFANSFLFEGGISAVSPGLPYKSSSYAPVLPKPAPLAGEHTQLVLDRYGSEKIREENLPSGGIRRADEKILKGIRVLDLTRMLAGPYATRILADFGAEVVKIQSEKTAHGAERNDTPYFSAGNRNKRSVTLDLSLQEARNAFMRLVAISDVIVENFSPRVMANWGLDYDRLKKTKPDLVMISISAMGQSGPWKDFVGFAPTFHALSGLLSAASGNESPPTRLGFPYADIIAGLYAAMAIISALEYRDRTGEGQYIDLSAYEALCTLLGPAFLESQLDSKFQISNSKLDLHSGIWNLESGIFKCSGEDRWCVISLENEEEGRTLCRVAGISHLTDELIGQWTAAQTAESVVDQLQRSGIAAGVVQNAEDLAKDGQLAARRFFVSLEHPLLGEVVSDRSALWDWRKKPKWKSSPLLGEDNDRFQIPNSKLQND